MAARLASRKPTLAHTHQYSVGKPLQAGGRAGRESAGARLLVFTAWCSAVERAEGGAQHNLQAAQE